MNRATQLARGAAAAAVAVFLAAFSHGVAAGEAPGWVGLVLSAVFALGVSVALLGRRGGPVRTVLAVGSSQAVFHLLFSLGTGDATVLEVSGAGHHQHVAVAQTAGESVATAAHAHGDAAMLAGHVLAGVATVLYLLAVEAAAWRALSRAVRGFVRSVTAVDAPAPVALPLAPAARPAVERARLRGRALLAQLRHRGPPVRPAFA